MTITIKSIVGKKLVSTKYGEKEVVRFNTEDDVLMDTFAKIEQGGTYEGEIIENEYGTRFIKAKVPYTGSAGAATGKPQFSPEYLEKKNELGARQTAINCAVTMASAHIEAGDKLPKGEELKMAEFYLKWLKGSKVEPDKEEVDLSEIPF